MEKTHSLKREGFSIEKMNYTFYELSESKTHHVFVCVCACAKEKKRKREPKQRGRKHSDGSNLILCCVFAPKFISKC